MIERLVPDEVENIVRDFMHGLDEFRLARIAAFDALDETFQVHMF